MNARIVKRFAIRYLGGVCIDCGGEFHPVCMDFDHREPMKKSYNIAAMLNTHSLGRIMEELDKCDLVCANCHRLRTHIQE